MTQENKTWDIDVETKPGEPFYERPLITVNSDAASPEQLTMMESAPVMLEALREVAPLLAALDKKYKHQYVFKVDGIVQAAIHSATTKETS